jgi:serine/threonine protein kinase
MLNTIQSLVHLRACSVEVSPRFPSSLVYNNLSDNASFLKRAASDIDTHCTLSTPYLDDYEFLRTLGSGANATVYLVREKHTSHLYALKAVDKYTATGKKIACSTVINEQAALTMLNGNDFILPLHACFHDTENYYLVTVRAHCSSP